MEKSSNSTKEFPLLLRVAPGLANLLEYRREWLRHDAVAGRIGRRGGSADCHCVCAAYWLRSSGGPLRINPPASGLCGLAPHVTLS
jgi:hypothetical protein